MVISPEYKEITQRIGKAALLVGIPLIFFLAYSGYVIMRISGFPAPPGCIVPVWKNVSTSIQQFDVVFFNPFISSNSILEHGMAICTSLNKEVLP
jgi:hypothetical protein